MGTPNLLQIVPAKVAVSSTVDNPRDFPEHVMDGRLDTAWNGKTGDLGAWIAFRVPADAHVDRVDLTVGYDRKTAKEDLFTENHRIQRVALSRNGQKLRDVTLDPDKRGWQSVPVDTDGGDFKLEVLATKAGTRAEWKEIVISELRVAGRPGKERRPPGEPLRISVGSLDAAIKGTLPTERVRAVSPGAAKAVNDLCAEYIKKSTPVWEEMQRDPGDGPNAEMRSDWKAPNCKSSPWSGTFTGDATWKNVAVVRTSLGVHDGQQLAVELARGWTLLDIVWADSGANLTGCPSVFEATSVPAIRVDHGALLVTVDGFAMTGVTPDPKDPNDDGMRGSLQRGAYACRDMGSAIECDFHNPQYQGALAIKVSPRKNGNFRDEPWAGASKFHVDADGKIAVDP